MTDDVKEAESRVRFIQHRGKSILLQDFSNLKPGLVFEEGVRIAMKLISSQPPKSVLTVVDATNAVFDAGVLVTLKAFVKHNTPYMKCTAVSGIKGLKEVGLMAVAKVAGRPIHTFDTRDKALDFLAEQE